MGKLEKNMQSNCQFHKQKLPNNNQNFLNFDLFCEKTFLIFTWFESKLYLYFFANNFDIEILIAYDTMAILIAGCMQIDIRWIGGTFGAGKLILISF